MNRLFNIHIIIYFFLFYSLIISSSFPQSLQDRIHLGIKLFPTIVGGNLDLKSQCDSNGYITLLVVYSTNQIAANKAFDTLQHSVDKIYHYPIHIYITNDLNFSNYQDKAVSGIFISEKLPAYLIKKVVRFGVQNKVIVFSPFIDDVEAGVTAGLFISTQIKPALNINTINKSHIHINQLFYKVAKVYP